MKYRSRDRVSLARCTNEVIEGFFVCFAHVDKDALLVRVQDLERKIKDLTLENK